MSRGGDILELYNVKRFTQQSHADIRPEIDEMIIVKTKENVYFKDGAFLISNDFFWGWGWVLSGIEDVKDYIFGNDRREFYEEDEMICDHNGNIIDESIIGIEIIGKQWENTK